MKNEMNKKCENIRPVWHYSINKGWMNDPNGLIYYKGYYHLYFQYYPYAATHGPMHWGHVKSKDLIHWTDVGIALYPDAMGEIYSGCMVYDKDNKSELVKNEKPLIAVFTQHRIGGNGKTQEVQSIAYSLDEGTSFIKYSGNPVLTDSNSDFRDPKIIYSEKTDSFVMLLARGLEICFYESRNLRDWIYNGSYSHTKIDGERVWECPDLIRFKKDDDKEVWALLFSTNTQGKENDAVYYLMGSFNGHAFTPDKTNCIHKMDFGSDFYAAATYVNQEKRNILLAWMNNWNYAEKIPGNNFRGCLTIPRELYLKDIDSEIYICQKTIEELENNICESKEEYTDGKLELTSNPCIIEITGIRENMNITISNEQSEAFTINYNRNENKVTMDRSKCHCEFAETSLNVRSTVLKNPIRNMKLLMDTTSIELFINEGEMCGTMLCFWNNPYQVLTATDRNLQMRLLNRKGEIDEGL